MTNAREHAPTVAFIDDYCAHYRSVLPNVRQFEQFTRLERGLVAETKRKSPPRLAGSDRQGRPPSSPPLPGRGRVVCGTGAGAAPGASAPGAARAPVHPVHRRDGRAQEGRNHRRRRQPIHRQHPWIPGLAKGVVAVNAYGVLDTITFPLACRIDTPERRLKPGAVFTSTPQLADELIQELAAQGCHFSVVLARRARQPVWRAL